MDRKDYETPAPEEFSPLPEEYPVPPEEAEFRPPDPEGEFSRPAETDFAPADPYLEFTPPGRGGAAPSRRPKRRRMIRRLLYSAAALTMAGVLFVHAAPGTAVLPAAAPESTAAPAAAPAAQTPVLPSGVPEASAAPEPVSEPVSEPEPVFRAPEIGLEFFSFSHEHYGRIRLKNAESLRSVRVEITDTALGLTAYEHELSPEEMASGLFELPMISTGDLYMAHMEEYDAALAWPEFHMTVTALYEDEEGNEQEMSLEADPGFELGMGAVYWPYDWDEQIAPDSFRFSPWEEIDEISYVINDPDAVTSPVVFSVDVSFNGRHADPADYETVLYKDEYDVYDPDTGEFTPTSSVTKVLVLHRPDWMPEKGTVHVTIVQMLAGTGEKWVKEFDISYPQD